MNLKAEICNTSASGGNFLGKSCHYRNRLTKNYVRTNESKIVSKEAIQTKKLTKSALLNILMSGASILKFFNVTFNVVPGGILYERGDIILRLIASKDRRYQQNKAKSIQKAQEWR